MPAPPAAGRGCAGCRAAGPAASTTNSEVIGRSRAFMTCSASAASASGAIVRGAVVMISPTWRDSRSGPMARRRSPSVTMPISLPAASTTPRQPKRFSVISSSARSIGVSGGASGIASPSCIRSRTRRSRAPSRPPGWNWWKSAAVKPRRVSSATASASPSAICMVVEVVGARPIGQASAAAGSVSATSAASASVDPARAVIATSGRPKRRECATRSASSAVSPELDRASTASPGTIMPRSPCEASAGWTNRAGVPVEASVAAILRATWPDLPMPDTTTRPVAARQQVDRAGEAAVQPGGERLQAGRLGVQHRAGDIDGRSWIFAWRSAAVIGDSSLGVRRPLTGQPDGQRPDKNRANRCRK